MNLKDGVSIYESLEVTLFSMAIVFVTLIIISLILSAFKLIFYREDDKKVEVVKKPSPTVGNNPSIDNNMEYIDEEIIAVIISAIKAHGASIPHSLNGDIKAAMLASIVAYEGKNSQELRISNIRIIS